MEMVERSMEPVSTAVLSCTTGQVTITSFVQSGVLALNGTWHAPIERMFEEGRRTQFWNNAGR